MPSSSRTTTPYAFSQPGIASVSSSSASQPSTGRSPYGQHQPQPQHQHQHNRTDSSGRSSALPLAHANGSSSSTTHLLAQRSGAHIPLTSSSSSSSSHLPMPSSSSTYSPRAGGGAGAAPLLGGYNNGHGYNAGSSSSASSVANGSNGRGPFYDPDFERLADSTSSRGGGPSSRNGSFAGGVDGGRGSISSLGSVTSMGYTPRAQVGMYDAGSVASHASSSTVGQQYALGGDPSQWARSGSPEPDDYLHMPDPKRDQRKDHGGSILTFRGLMNLGTLFILGSALFMLFAGYPIYEELSKRQPRALGAFNLGGVNASGQVPQVIGDFGLIDKDTPQAAYSMVSGEGTTWELVFSDEFETEGRSFYPGDDPYWEAIDLHAWGTNDLEWYDPKQSTTKGGKLVQTLERRPINDLDYAGGSIQGWNKFCFQGGRVEAKIRLPGSPTVNGLWPAFWTMGNLGRVGYGGTLEGTWPYSYDSCDVGTLANQTLNGEPAANLHNGLDSSVDYALSYLSGQRLSACTCPDDETHPGPKMTDGSFRGRSAPEIDVIEAQVHDGVGEVSLSAQWAPFDAYYEWNNVTYSKVEDPDKAYLNTYKGGPFQQTSSYVGITNQECYQYPLSGAEEGCFAVYAFEYKLGKDGYIKWYNDDELAWTYLEGGLGPNPASGVSNRPIPYEPMYIIFNLAISLNFGAINFEGLEPLWPMKMEVDYVRVYQDPNEIRIGCDPDDAPTAKYIERYAHAYSNPNITTWDQMTNNGPKPKNRLIDTC